MSGIPDFRVILKCVMKKRDSYFRSGQEPAALPFAPVRYGTGVLHAGEYEFKHFLFNRFSPRFFAVPYESVVHFSVRDMC